MTLYLLKLFALTIVVRFSFAVSTVIEGWRQALQNMCEGQIKCISMMTAVAMRIRDLTDCSEPMASFLKLVCQRW